MKKNIICAVIFLVCITRMQLAFCQTEKFDIIAYIPPKGWQKDSKQSLISFITVNENSGGFCLIALYTATPGSGSPEKDFENEWNDLVVKPYGAAKDPKTETQTNADGWKVTAGASAVQKNNSSSYIILTVFSGFDKTVSVLANLNDQVYISEIEKFLDTMKPDKAATLAGKKSQNNNTSSVVKENDRPGRFGKMVYRIPPGWKEAVNQNGILVTPSDLPAKESLSIQVIQPMNFSGTIEEALEKSYNETCRMLQAEKMFDVNGKNYSVTEAKKSFRGWEYIRCSGGIHVNNGTPYPDEYGLDLFVIKLNNRFERIATIKSRNTCNGLSRYYSDARKEYAADIENFLFSLKFDDWQEQPVTRGTAKGNGIIGVWQGISLSVGASKPGAVLGAELNVKQLILFSNGQAYFGKYFPTEGLDEINTLIKAEINRRSWGTYTFTNGKGVVSMPYENIPMRLENNKLILTTNKTDHGFIKLNPVDGARFNGTYVLNEWNGKIPSITFNTDGKFIDNGAVRIMYHEYTDCLNKALAPGTGTYEVKNNSLIFNYSDGRRIKIAFPGTSFTITNNSPSTLVLSFNEDVLKKQ